jgi:PleD family two-component response regulator
LQGEGQPSTSKPSSTYMIAAQAAALPKPNAPLILLIDDQEWTSRSIESVLQPRGCAVVRAFTGRQALQLVDKLSPDAIVIDFHLPDLDCVDVVTQLRRSPSVSPATPILMVTSSKLTRAARLSVLGAGVWDVLRHPVDFEEFVLRLDSFISVKQSSDALREEGLADPTTGFYNAQGLLRRAREISADARRLERAVGCVALGGDLFDHGDVRSEADLTPDEIELIDALRSVTRVSDAVGRLPTGEFVILAPGADEEGVLALIDRMKTALDRAGRDMARRVAVERLWRGLRGGYATAGLTSPTDPEDLLLRATKALRRAQADDSGESFTVRAYEA